MTVARVDLCTTCDAVKTDKGHPRYWLCGVFERQATCKLTGDPEPPYHYVSDVRRLSRNGYDCPFWRARKETEKEAIVKDSPRGRSVTFADKNK